MDQRICYSMSWYWNLKRVRRNCIDSDGLETAVISYVCRCRCPSRLTPPEEIGTWPYRVRKRGARKSLLLNVLHVHLPIPRDSGTTRVVLLSSYTVVAWLVCIMFEHNSIINYACIILSVIGVGANYWCASNLVIQYKYQCLKKVMYHSAHVYCIDLHVAGWQLQKYSRFR